MDRKMGKAKEYWFKEAEQWMINYPLWKRSLPASPSLFNYQEFHRVDLIEQAIGELSDEEKKLLELLYWKKKSYVAISMTLHMSEMTVYRTKVRILWKLANQLGIYQPLKERA